MSEVEQVERHIEKLSAADLAKFRAWFFEFDARVWDAQIESELCLPDIPDCCRELSRQDLRLPYGSCSTECLYSASYILDIWENQNNDCSAVGNGPG